MALQDSAVKVPPQSVAAATCMQKMSMNRNTKKNNNRFLDSDETFGHAKEVCGARLRPKKAVAVIIWTPIIRGDSSNKAIKV